MNIAAHFGVSLDCLINGTAASDNILEEKLSRLADAEILEFAHAQSFGRIISRFYSLPRHHQERLVGYLDALCKEN